MDDKQAKFQINRLRAEIAEHERLYRKENAPVISDDEFDSLVRELRLLEEQFPQFASPDSPTVNVGDDLSEGFEAVEHLAPMLSLDNVFNTEELEDFDKRLRKVLQTEDELAYSVEPKIDGAGISAVYENGELVRLLTRGNGEKGDDITRNASVIKNLPRRLSGKYVPALLEVRGEAYMTIAEFERIKNAIRAGLIAKECEKKRKEAQKKSAELLNAENFTAELSSAELEEIEKKLPANPRNLTAGTMKLLDKSILAGRNLQAIFYSLGRCEGCEIKKQSELPGALEALGLPSVNWHENANGAKGAFERISELEEVRASFPYQTDGAVVKLDDVEMQARAGLTSKAPRWAAAWKYRAERGETKLKSITIQVGRTGAVTPVAELETIPLSGTKVSRATLHNAGYIEEKDIREGDTVLVEKAGEIIPAVLGVVLEKRPENSVPFVFPAHCPECGSELKRYGEKMLYRCPNLSCPPQVLGRLEHFASRNCMDIRGLGDKIVEQLVEKLGVRDPSDLYTLTRDQLLKLDKFKDKSADNLLNSLEESKSRELWRLIFGLGILEIGEQFAKELARKFKSMDALMEATLDEIKEIEGFGGKAKKKKNGEGPEPIRALSIRAFFDDEHNRALIEKLRGLGLNFYAESAAPDFETPFSGKTFVLTGSLSSMGRTEAKKLIESFGGKTASSVTSQTSFLISDGKISGSKMKKAQKLGTAILTEADFLKMLEDAQKLSDKTQKTSDGHEPAQLSSEEKTPGTPGQLELF